MAGLSVDLVSADRKVWSGTARAVSAPSVDGQIGILSGHTPILAVLRAGTVRVTTDGAEPFEVHVTGGFVSVDDDLVTVVADEISPVTGAEG
ncbi:H+transporting two-sector ATPase delta/epsilon subunit [Xylanimonas cellulosilytica DSM 15894]|uniref:ATP synthase epsilon chain n=1 Tax=Xylanimonas cellulosilytica (strain DSM 15894 / JCM 12276 / CECT 5975 / KCTC 9989 / LMG 20990 / NBRC 107835 / XIL07) TaxID=446471 RepID=D1BWB7_XYLCX|nr:F0F1 ATP synthase subunit epsilon [Xylanimonas cellulosilytica]ACZ31462.1 H+transporting two-sector ATPase delta/epsilon subunit [Xylanimonas cellulosilytica DSM 15894]